MKTKVAVTAIIENGDAILMGRKLAGQPPYPDTWHIPGGRLEENESIEEGIKREIREETQLDITQLKPLTFGEDFTRASNGEMTHFVYLYFGVTYESGEVIPASDLVELAWIKKSDLPTLAANHELPPPSEKIFRFMGWLT